MREGVPSLASGRREEAKRRWRGQSDRKTVQRRRGWRGDEAAPGCSGEGYSSLLWARRPEVGTLGLCAVSLSLAPDSTGRGAPGPSSSSLRCSSRALSPSEAGTFRPAPPQLRALGPS